MREVQVAVDGGRVSASVHGEGTTCLVLGHGAGGDRRNSFLARVAEAVAGSGRSAVLFNFPYSEARRRVPDPPARLEATTRAVGELARAELGAVRVVHGGKSMGGRIASQAVAAGAPAAGLVFLGYPLHPPGRVDALRDRHLPSVPVPMLFIQGTRDAFARWDLIESVVARLGPRARLHRIEGGDHSFSVRKGGGGGPVKKDAVEAEIHGAMLSWLAEQGL